MIKDCPIHKKKLAAKKPGQKHPFGHATRQENNDSPMEESTEGGAEEENTEDAEEDSHFGERDK